MKGLHIQIALDVKNRCVPGIGDGCPRFWFQQCLPVIKILGKTLKFAVLKHVILSAKINSGYDNGNGQSTYDDDPRFKEVTFFKETYSNICLCQQKTGNLYTKNNTIEPFECNNKQH